MIRPREVGRRRGARAAGGAAAGGAAAGGRAPLLPTKFLSVPRRTSESSIPSYSSSISVENRRRFAAAFSFAATAAAIESYNVFASWALEHITRNEAGATIEPCRFCAAPTVVRSQKLVGSATGASADAAFFSLSCFCSSRPAVYAEASSASDGASDGASAAAASAGAASDRRFSASDGRLRPPTESAGIGGSFGPPLARAAVRGLVFSRAGDGAGAASASASSCVPGRLRSAELSLAMC